MTHRKPSIDRIFINPGLTGASTLLCALACGAPDPSEAFNLADSEEAITGGTLVGSVENADTTKPFGGAVKLGTASGTFMCSAMKIEANKFLTAAHCMSRFAPSAIKITNSTGGAFPAQTYTIVPGSWLRHPSFALGNSGGPTVDTGLYDIGQFRIAEATASIPAIPVTSITVFPGNTGYTGVGYGCDDLDVPRLGMKQKGTFQASSLSLVHYIQDTGNPTTCSGDSGGALFTTTGFNPGAVIGVVAGGTTSNSLFTRVGNVRDWILDPRMNVFANASGGYLMSAAAVGQAFPKLRCAVSVGTGTASGTDVRLGECDHFSGQLSGSLGGWTLFDAGGGAFKITNKWSQLCLGTSGDNVAAFTCNGATNQAWTVAPLTGGTTYYQFKNKSSSKCLGVPSGDSNADVRQYTCSSSFDQSWVFTR